MVLLGSTWPLWRRLRPAFPCSRCGETVCSRCYPELSAGELCVQCHHIYLRGVSLDPKLRLEKEASIHRHQGRRRRLRVILSAILMGAGQVLAGRPGRGIGLLLLFFFLVLSAIFWNGVIRYPLGSDTGPSVGKMVLLALFFLPAYLLGLAGVLRR
jgi:TM2 domain-containing membrane protein YozV